MNNFISAKQPELTKVLDFFKKDITSLRTGRATPAMLENVQVESYGSKMPVNAVGNITVVDARCLTITPWDKNVLKDLEKSIVVADLGVSVVNEGDKLRLSMPMLSEENRKELIKKLNVKMEDSRISLRQVRDEIKKDIETAFTDKAISEDDKFRFIKELDEEITKTNDKLKEIRDVKEKEIMTI